MNDRFKFRVWNKIVNDFVPATIREDGSFSVDQNEFEFKYGDDWDYVFEEENNIVEQCTGLKDKKGKLIYEGDIVKVFGFTDWYILVCRFRDSSFCLDHADGRPYNFVHSVAPVEVIGNIHEKKEVK